ncbi:MAG: hypothetical protein AVDCRST_MAG85-15 [uncultured Solirubrobacteraceae bacterium]|uniref:Uncharacterized protein n=1 Tax=uncultured Solirubrobacteraceae bacterium TaxID=1162706 RepID=A0A6J4REW7_9ACTN|nr:MAG: hypothetical protein AVDCRST_MAG85-15 [uncultured Solirubrobacteraceae bacterium]
MLLVGAIGVVGAIAFALATLRASDSTASMLAGLTTGLALSLAAFVLFGWSPLVVMAAAVATWSSLLSGRY